MRIWPDGQEHGVSILSDSGSVVLGVPLKGSYNLARVGKRLDPKRPEILPLLAAGGSDGVVPWS
jgi:hypothetical protein